MYVHVRARNCQYLNSVKKKKKEKKKIVEQILRRCYKAKTSIFNTCEFSYERDIFSVHKDAFESAKCIYI